MTRAFDILDSLLCDVSDCIGDLDYTTPNLQLSNDQNNCLASKQKKRAQEAFLELFVAQLKGGSKMKARVMHGSNSWRRKAANARAYMTPANMEGVLILVDGAMSCVQGVFDAIPRFMQGYGGHLNHGLERGREFMSTGVEAKLSSSEWHERKKRRADVRKVLKQAHTAVATSDAVNARFIERRQKRMDWKYRKTSWYTAGAAATAAVSLFEVFGDHWLEHAAWFASGVTPLAATLIALRDLYKGVNDLQSAWRSHKRCDPVYLWFDRYTKWQHAKRHVNKLKQSGGSKTLGEWAAKEEQYRQQLDAIYIDQGFSRKLITENNCSFFDKGSHHLSKQEQSLFKKAVADYKPNTSMTSKMAKLIAKNQFEQHSDKRRRLGLQGGMRIARVVGLACIALSFIPGLQMLAVPGVMITAAVAVPQVAQVVCNWNMGRLKTSEKHFIMRDEACKRAIDDYAYPREGPQLEDDCYAKLENKLPLVERANLLKYLDMAYRVQCRAKGVEPGDSAYTAEDFKSEFSLFEVDQQFELLQAAKNNYCQNEFLCKQHGITKPEEKQQFLGSLSGNQRIALLKKAVQKHPNYNTVAKRLKRGAERMRSCASRFFSLSQRATSARTTPQASIGCMRY